MSWNYVKSTTFGFEPMILRHFHEQFDFDGFKHCLFFITFFKKQGTFFCSPRSIMIDNDQSWSIKISNDPQWYKFLNITRLRKNMTRYINICRISCQSRFWRLKPLENTLKVAKWCRNNEISIEFHGSFYFFTEISEIAGPTWKTNLKRR